MAQDLFIKIEGIEGESQDFYHKGEIDLLRWDWTVSQPSNMHTGCGGGAGKTTVYDLCFKHYFDKASTSLLKYCLSGKHIPEAVLTVRKSGGNPLEFLKITLQEIVITSVDSVGEIYMPSPIEKVSLQFARVKFEYIPQNAEGGSMGIVAVGYDIKANTII